MVVELFKLQDKFVLIIAEQVEDKVESVQDSEGDQLSSSGDSEEDGTKSDCELIERVYYQVRIQW